MVIEVRDTITKPSLLSITSYFATANTLHHLQRSGVWRRAGDSNSRSSCELAGFQVLLVALKRKSDTAPIGSATSSCPVNDHASRKLRRTAKSLRATVESRRNKC